MVVPDYEEERFANDAGQEESYATWTASGPPNAGSEPSRVQRRSGWSGSPAGPRRPITPTELAHTYAPEDGIEIDLTFQAADVSVANNRADNNLGTGIDAAGVIDGGGDLASGNRGAGVGKSWPRRG